jgi:spore coat polysaccharide biosynthesis protein SpsF
MGKTLAIVQARMGASRLPGKPLLPLGDRPVLGWVIERLRRAGKLDQLVVATSTAPQDDVLVQRCAEWGIDCHRGSERDVLGRFREAAEAFGASAIVRVCADNPLISSSHVDELVEALRATGTDYVGFQLADSSPAILTGLGFFAEALSLHGLTVAAESIDAPNEREHVTLGIYTRPDRFTLRYLAVPACCEDRNLRFTLDTPLDLEVLREVFAVLGSRALSATPEEVVSTLDENPQWLASMRRSNQENPKGSGAPKE